MSSHALQACEHTLFVKRVRSWDSDKLERKANQRTRNVNINTKSEHNLNKQRKSCQPPPIFKRRGLTMAIAGS